MNIEIIRNTLYKAYLESFYDYCKNLGGTTAQVMCEILAVSTFMLCLMLNASCLYRWVSEPHKQLLPTDIRILV